MRSSTPQRLLVLASVLGTSSCGALVDATWQGKPLLVFSGTVFLDDTGIAERYDLTKLRTTVSFIDPAGEPTGAAAFNSADLSASTSFPASYTVEIFQPPPEAARFVTPWDPNGPMIAVALPLLYLDENGNETWDSGTERLVGGSVDIVGVWSAGQVEGEEWDSAAWSDTASWDSGDPDFVFTDLQVPLITGYQRMSADIQWCGGTSEAPTSRFDLLPAQEFPVDMFVGRWFRDITQWGCWQ
jgi:hypothetical protein